MDDLESFLAAGEYDFIDLGCSKGGSLEFGKRWLGGKKGLGIDIVERKVLKTRERGLDACWADARDISLHPDSVRFVTMLHFLEHLPSIYDAEKCIESACDASTDFVYIRQPWFDSDGYLFSRGLKLYFSYWRHHPNAMTTLEFHKIMSRIKKVKRWRLYGWDEVTSSDHFAVLPLSTPHNVSKEASVEYKPIMPVVKFDQPVFRNIGCVALLKDDPGLLDHIERSTKWTSVLYDSAGGELTRNPKDKT